MRPHAQARQMCALEHTFKKPGAVDVSTDSKPAYWRCSLRLSRFMAAHCRRLAIREGWEIADLARMLICLGAIASFLSLREQETAESFKRRAIMSETVTVLDSVLGRPSRRPHALPGIGESELLTVRLPLGLSRIVAAYANTSGRSVNHALRIFLERGLIMYMKGENNLLETVRSINEELAKTKGLQERKSEGE